MANARIAAHGGGNASKRNNRHQPGGYPVAAKRQSS
jgi:hypothetical protein